MPTFLWRGLFSLLLLVSVAACQITKPYQRPEVRVEALYRDQTPADTTTLAQLPWRAIFTDPQLQALIAEGIERNLDLQVAMTRVQQADANFRQSRAAFLPTLSATGTVNRTKQPAFPGFGTLPVVTQYLLFGTASWEADVWGRLRNAKKAALAQLRQSEAYQRTVQTTLVANIATAYYQLLALDQQLEITRQTVLNREQDVKTMQALSEAGIVTGAAVVQSDANRYAARVIIPDLQQQIRETENSLSLLLARPPGPISRNTLASQQPIKMLQTGVPAQLLRYRPDVQQAEYAYRSAFALTNAARANFYPALTLTATGGYSTFEPKTLLNPASVFYSFVGGLLQPILNQGVNKARLRVSQAQQQEAQLNFRTSLLTGGQEVSDALYSYQVAAEKVVERTQQLDALRKSVVYSQALLKNGFANYTEVLTAQQSLLAAQLSGVSDRQQQLQAVTTLYRALGGGWQ